MPISVADQHAGITPRLFLRRSRVLQRPDSTGRTRSPARPVLPGSGKPCLDTRSGFSQWFIKRRILAEHPRHDSPPHGCGARRPELEPDAHGLGAAVPALLESDCASHNTSTGFPGQRRQWLRSSTSADRPLPRSAHVLKIRRDLIQCCGLTAPFADQAHADGESRYSRCSAMMASLLFAWLLPIPLRQTDGETRESYSADWVHTAIMICSRNC